jgi:hypothetical protein
MTRVMLIAGVAALAISAPAAAGPHGHGDRGGPAAAHGGGGGGGGHAFAAPRPNRGGGGGFRMQAYGGGRHAAPRMQRAPMQRMSVAQHNHGNGGSHMQRQAMQHQRSEQHGQRQAMQHQRTAQRGQRQAMQRQHAAQRQARAAQQRNGQRQARANQQQQMRANHEQARNQMIAKRQQARNRMLANRMADRRQFAQNRMANRMDRMQVQRQRAQFARLPQRQLAANFTPRNANYGRRGMIAPAQAMRLVGGPVSRVASYGRLAELPRSVRYLYPDTPDRYYRYGDGYLYQVDRRSDVVDALLPLVGGGFVPGMTFPTEYMGSYVPAAYGMNSFYPDSEYANYRYLDGNVYSVDPYSGAIDDVIPTYAYGYGVGQMLPAGYGYYNVPSQYRGTYYDTPESNYWYAPGAIYQVDPASQLITGVASLLAPGLAVGQPLPAGYGMYNVPLAYRATYYDTPNAWYRYNNGYIYQVDPTTQLVTAVVASLLT